MLLLHKAIDNMNSTFLVLRNQKHKIFVGSLSSQTNCGAQKSFSHAAIHRSHHKRMAPSLAGGK